MVCLELKPGAAGWKAQTNPLSYGGSPNSTTQVKMLAQHLHSAFCCLSYGLIVTIFVIEM